MTVLFPKWTNKIPAMLALGAAATGLCVVLVVFYWFSPRHTDVGYEPFQPIAYSHKLHAGALGMDCRYCHRMVEQGPNASVPDLATCMGCHLQVKKDSLLLEPLRAAYGDGTSPAGSSPAGSSPAGSGPAGSSATGNATSIEWVKVHLLPQYAYFNHSVHLRAGVGCVSCHGRVDQMETVRQMEPLSMGWCLACHRDAASSIRPSDVPPTKMDWVADDQSIAAARKRLDWQGETPPELNPPTHCSACHR